MPLEIVNRRSIIAHTLSLTHIFIYEAIGRYERKTYNSMLLLEEEFGNCLESPSCGLEPSSVPAV